ncbi:MAG: polysaccharide pyruvyl transferase family protein [Clostridia bacterium]|nr:polysaccharide pyruvyl transferase family protein [Clostridia bacterium]
MSVGLSGFRSSVENKKIVCYGAGVNAQHMLYNEKFAEFLPRVSFFVDMDIKKTGTYIKTNGFQFEIFNVDALKNIASDSVVVITLSDYLSTGKMLDSLNIEWYVWTIISTELDFSKFRAEDARPRIFLLNTPDYMNLGDQAIALAEQIYINENFGEFYEIGSHMCHPDALTELSKYIKKNDILMFQGGGNLGSLWRFCEEILRDILIKFPENLVVVFPQSVFYGDSEEEKEYFEKSQRIYNEHKHLVICTRDKQSYDFVTNSYNCKCLLLPDVVLTLKYSKNKQRHGIGLVLRNDKEQYISDTYHKDIYEVASLFEQDVKTITHLPADENISRSDRIKNVLDLYSSKKLIITDRLHGMVFSAITNTPCVVFDNSYGKTSNLYRTWLKDVSCITFTDILAKSDLAQLLKSKLDVDYLKLDVEKFSEEFKALTEIILKESDYVV